MHLKLHDGPTISSIIRLLGGLWLNVVRVIRMGVLDYVSTLLDFPTKRKRPKALRTVEIKVRMDCEGCERRVQNSVSSMKGVTSVDVSRKQNKLTVTGYVEAKKVLKKVRGTGKRAEMWPYVPYNLVHHPYAPQTYDKKAPPGFVRREDFAFSNPNTTEEEYATLFSDDNPNACSVM